jgi:hypothetical protein
MGMVQLTKQQKSNSGHWQGSECCCQIAESIILYSRGG